jgi:hypothetical protein
MPIINWTTFMSDGGPGHYKQRHNFYNMCELASCYQNRSTVGSDANKVAPRTETMDLDWIFLGPHHGKNNWDGITGILKNRWRSTEQLSDKPLFQNAADCAAYSNKNARKKKPGEEDVPYTTNARSTYACEHFKCYVTDPAELKMARSKAMDVSTVHGTQTHYHYRFLGTSSISLRWLACPCLPCGSKRWDACENKTWVGVFKNTSIHQVPPCWSGMPPHLADFMAVPLTRTVRSLPLGFDNMTGPSAR